MAITTSSDIIKPRITATQNSVKPKEKTCENKNCKLTITPQNTVNTYITITAKPTVINETGTMNLCHSCFKKLYTLTQDKNSLCIVKNILETNKGYQLNSCTGSRQVKIDGKPSQYYEFACPNHYQQAIQTGELKDIILKNYSSQIKE